MKIENRTLKVEVESVDDILKVDKVHVVCGNFCGSFRPVVFCENCVWYQPPVGDSISFCRRSAMNVQAKDYCSRGERYTGKEEP